MEMRQNQFDVAPGRKVLSISTVPEDHDSLCRILCDSGWSITRAFSCQQAIARLCRDRMGVIVCDCHLSDGSWRDILSYIAELTEPSEVIVSSRVVGADLRAEVRALGAFEVLPKPFRAEEVSRVVMAAWQNRAVRVQELAPA
jgi:DNA-binding NtrC family response regulator